MGEAEAEEDERYLSQPARGGSSDRRRWLICCQPLKPESRLFNHHRTRRGWQGFLHTSRPRGAWCISKRWASATSDEASDGVGGCCPCSRWTRCESRRQRADGKAGEIFISDVVDERRTFCGGFTRYCTCSDHRPKLIPPAATVDLPIHTGYFRSHT